MTIGEQKTPIRKWFASDNESSREHLRGWVKETPAPFPADLLARIAMEADNDAAIGQAFSRFALILVVALSICAVLRQDTNNLVANLPLVTLFLPLLLSGASQGMTGLRAA